MYFSTPSILEFARSRFREYRRRGPLLVLVATHTVILAAGFFAPYDYERQNRDSPLTPPTRIHFFDQHHNFHLRPFVYDQEPGRPDNADGAGQRKAFSVYFFVQGAKYRFLNLVPAQTHLFGVAPEGKILILGTDAVGRDQFSRLLYGGQISLFAGLIAAALSVSTGLVLGTLAGYYGKWLDDLLMRIAEAFLAIPWLYLLLGIRAFLPLSLDARSVFLLLMF